MRYLLPLLFTLCLFGCDESAPVTGDEARNPLIDSAEKYEQLFHSAKETNLALAEVYADLALSYSRQMPYEKGIADGEANLGYVKFRRAEFSAALNSYSSALASYETFRDTAAIAECCYRIALIHEGMQGYGQALEFANRALLLHRQLKNRAGVSSDLQTIGFTYADLSKYDSALAILNERIILESETGDSLSLARALADIGAVYTASGDAEKGLQSHQAALKKTENLPAGLSTESAQKFRATLLNEMAGEHFLLGDYGRAIRTGEESLELAASIGARELKCAAYKTLAELHGLTSREDIQMQYIEKYISLNDSLRDEDTEQWKAASAMRHQLAQADVERANTKAEELQQQLTEEEETAKQNLWIVIIVAMIILGSLTALLVATRKKLRN